MEEMCNVFFSNFLAKLQWALWGWRREGMIVLYGSVYISSHHRKLMNSEVLRITTSPREVIALHVCMYFCYRAAGGPKKEDFIKRIINYYIFFTIFVICCQKLLLSYNTKLRLLRATFVADRSLRGT